jgi:signal transduction histidine kinase
VIAHSPVRPRPAGRPIRPKGSGRVHTPKPPLRVGFLAAVVTGAGVSLFAAASPSLELGAQSVQLHFLLRAGSGFAALAAAQLVLGRFLRERSAADAALVVALSAFAAAGLAGSAFVSLAGAIEVPDWPSVTAGLLGGAFLAWAAFAPDRRLLPRDAAAATGVVTAMLALALAGLARPVGAVFFFAAACGFARRAGRRHDVMSAGAAAASILAMFVELDAFLLPAVRGGAAAVADLLTFASSLALLGATTAGVRRYWQDAGSSESRRRVARDLHDGLAQELALLVMRSRSGAQQTAPGSAPGDVLDSSQRALEEARHVIAALTRPAGLPFAEALASEVEEVALRIGLRLRLELEDVSLSDSEQDALLRIAREALALVVAAAGARSARVVLADESGACLRIDHDGAALGHTSDCAGLLSIERRAREVGGTLSLQRGARGCGVIQVSLP